MVAGIEAASGRPSRASHLRTTSVAAIFAAPSRRVYKTYGLLSTNQQGATWAATRGCGDGETKEGGQENGREEGGEEDGQEARQEGGRAEEPGALGRHVLQARGQQAGC